MTGIKKLILYSFAAVSIFFFSTHLQAQPVSKPYYHFKTLTTADGLLSNTIHSVYKDTRGFLWISTDRGLQRFNGSSFINFRHLNADSSSIACENIASVSEDSQHDIWICTQESITKFDYKNGKLINYKYGYKNAAKMKFNEVFYFFEDHKGDKWIGTMEGLFLFEKTKQQFNHVEAVSDLKMKNNVFHYITKIDETADQELIFSILDGIVIIDKKGKQQYIPVPRPEDKKTVFRPCFLLPLLKDSPDEIWLSSLSNGIFKYNRITKDWTHYPFIGQGNGAFASSSYTWSSTEWFLGLPKFCLFNHRTGVYTNLFEQEKVRDVHNIFKDADGNIWMPSSADGLHILNVSTQLFSATQKIPGLRQEGMMYFDSSKETIYNLNPYFSNDLINFNISNNKVSRDSIPEFIPFVKVANNFIEDDDILYIATWSGMYKYDLQKHLLDSIVYNDGNLSSMNDGFFDVCKSEDKIYFAGRMKTGGPFMYDKRTHTITDLKLIYQKDTANIAHGYSLTFSNHVLYVGMNLGDSIYCYNEINGEKTSIAVSPTYKNEYYSGISALCIDKKENLWCGAGKNGIYVYNIPTKKWVKHIGQQEGYFPSLSNQLICDEDGNIWCNSSEGLYVFNNTDFLFKHFTVNDGLSMEREGGSLAQISGHRIAYSNIKAEDDVSFGIINTKPFSNNIQIIPLSISDLKVLGKPFLADTLLDNVQQITLPPNHNAFSLNYAGLHLTEGKNFLYTYLLEGAEKNWHDAGDNQNLSYLNLTPGKYILHIKCKSQDKKIISKERLLYITLLPAWYQTWWFKLMSIFMIAFLLFLWIRYYLNQKIKKQEAILENEKNLIAERNRIASDMHDDVGAGLSRIRYITASMKKKKEMNEADIDKIVSLSDESVEKMNEIIWALNQGNQQLEELIYYTRSQCSEMVNNAGLKFIFNVTELIPSKTINWKDSRNIYLLVKETVNNAIKHAGATEISINFMIDDILLITIKDNGIGFDIATSREEGNGLKNYKKRIESVNGTYLLNTSPGNGTELRFEIPLADK